MTEDRIVKAALKFLNSITFSLNEPIEFSRNKENLSINKKIKSGEGVQESENCEYPSQSIK